jgi:hypothetical protein
MSAKAAAIARPMKLDIDDCGARTRARQRKPVMQKEKRTDDLRELVSLVKACADAGICVPTALKLAAKNQFPKITAIGRKRVVGKRAYLRWIADRNGDLDGASAA